MQFDQLFFVFVFLPLGILLYAFVPARLKNAALLLISLVFAAWGRPFDAALIVASGIFNYIAGLLMGVLRENGKRRAAAAVLVFGAAVDIALLALYRYLPAALPVLRGLSAPVGLSFFTFSEIGYLFDVNKGTCRPQRDPVKFLLFVTLFVKLVSGPIASYHGLENQLSVRKSTLSRSDAGLVRFTVGLAKKLLIADALGRIFAQLSAQGAQSVLGAWITALCYAFTLYYDFSGYSDMAIGLGSLFGFDLPENFIYPYVCDTMTGFWRSWHASLGAWFRDYVYIPLGGSRKGKLRTVLNLLAVWILTGLWHGATLCFIVWGLYHFTLLFLEKFVFGGIVPKIPKVIRVPFVFLAAVIGWVPFFSGDIGSALGLLEKMFGGAPLTVSTDLYWLGVCAPIMIAAAVGAAGLPAKLHAKLSGRSPAVMKAVGAVGAVVLLALCAAVMTGQTYVSFLYAGF